MTVETHLRSMLHLKNQFSDLKCSLAIDLIGSNRSNLLPLYPYTSKKKRVKMKTNLDSKLQTKLGL